MRPARTTHCAVCRAAIADTRRRREGPGGRGPWQEGVLEGTGWLSAALGGGWVGGGRGARETRGREARWGQITKGLRDKSKEVLLSGGREQWGLWAAGDLPTGVPTLLSLGTGPKRGSDRQGCPGGEKWGDLRHWEAGCGLQGGGAAICSGRDTGKGQPDVVFPKLMSRRFKLSWVADPGRPLLSLGEGGDWAP